MPDRARLVIHPKMHPPVQASFDEVLGVIAKSRYASGKELKRRHTKKRGRAS